MGDRIIASTSASETFKAAETRKGNVRFEPNGDPRVKSNVSETNVQSTDSPRAGPKSIANVFERKSSFFGIDKSLATGSVRLHRQKSCTNKGSEHDDKVSGFVDGNFASGKVLDLVVDRCFVTAFQNSSDDDGDLSNPFQQPVLSSFLAVGTSKSVALYETSSYALAYEIPRSGMVSAIVWFSPPSSFRSTSIENSSRFGQPSLLAVGGLEGTLSLYSIDASILESQGPTLVFEFQVADQVRALDCSYFGKLEPKTLLISVGDKSGNVTFCSMRCNFSGSGNDMRLSLEHIDTVIEQHLNTGVLGLSLSRKTGLIAACTKGGQVLVYKLHRQHSGAVYIEKPVWEGNRNGPVRCIVFSHDGSHLSFGGYDKTVVVVETEFWGRTRQLQMNGTVNTISLDPKGRYLGVGCRDKTFTLYDTSTYVAVKTFHATSWVTAASWEHTKSHSIGGYRSRDLVAVRTDNNCISVLDLKPISVEAFRLECQGEESAVSWSRNGSFIARSMGSSIIVADALEGYRDVFSFEMQGVVSQVSFCHAHGKENLLAAIDDSGSIAVVSVDFDKTGDLVLDEAKFGYAAPHLNALAWSIDGNVLATGGRDKFLYIFNPVDLKPITEPIRLQGRIWDIDFVPEQMSQVAGNKLLLGVALGDYTTVILDESFQPALQVTRSRTCRCLSFNPSSYSLAIGDGAGSVAIVDYNDEELVMELDVKGRVNVVKFSPAGDFLVIGTDDSRFGIHESDGYKCVQEIATEGFALSAAFSPTGMHLALGSANGGCKLLRLGPFLAVDLVPLTVDGGIDHIPSWAMKEALYRSWDGPSLIQRHMHSGEHENLLQVASILRNHPNSVYTFDRQTNEGSFATALNQKIPNLLKLAIMTLVDGTLSPKSDQERNFLTTKIPFQGREVLADIVKNYPADFAVDIFKAMTFMKVPLTSPKIVEHGSRLEIGSSSYTDPWLDRAQSGRYLEKTATSTDLGRKNREYITRTPAVLPLPGLGDMDFLASLLMFAPLEVFENEAMAVVVRVVWYNHVQKFFFLDCIVFTIYYICWVALVELTFSSEDAYKFNEQYAVSWMAWLTIFFNSLFAVKEIMQSRLGNREIYWRSMWNAIDISSVVCVYLYALNVLIRSFNPVGEVPLAVIATLLLTAKVLAYLRGFRDTGWLIAVLIANFRDVRGFLIILFVILVGFSVSFRALFGNSADESFGTLRRSLLSTFQLTLTSQYDTDTITDAEYQVLAVTTFVMAVTGVLVIALNALISVLADSYARVQQNAVANRRKEVAALIVEYMSLLTPRKRHEIEQETKWFHTLLEVDADGSLHVQTDDWEGGLNALRHEIKDIGDANTVATQRAINEMKAELESELSKFKKDVLSVLEDLTDDMKHLRKVQEKGIKLDGRNVVKAVQAVQAVGQKVGQQGGALLKLAEGQAVRSMGQYRGKSISTFTRC